MFPNWKGRALAPIGSASSALAQLDSGGRTTHTLGEGPEALPWLQAPRSSRATVRFWGGERAPEVCSCLGPWRCLLLGLAACLAGRLVLAWYILCDFKLPEGFSLRRNICIHIAFLLKTLLRMEEPVLVLSPWGHLYHWQSPDINQGSLGDNSSNQSNIKPLQNSVLLFQERCVHENPMSRHHYEFHFKVPATLASLLICLSQEKLDHKLCIASPPTIKTSNLILPPPPSMVIVGSSSLSA
ncbi:uncharacterized protein [Vicugna pacos]|uniref:Peptide-O-fucosyltransferase n=1 Tax=Vicugna pacos TaxID=30538 RepID=A0ABM5CZ27_VICPA